MDKMRPMMQEFERIRGRSLPKGLMAQSHLWSSLTVAASLARWSAGIWDVLQDDDAVAVCSSQAGLFVSK